MKISTLMLGAQIDFRILEYVKRGINKEYDESSLFIPLSAFRKYWKNLVKPEMTDLDPKIEEKIVKFVTTTEGEQIDKNRLFTLIDFYQYYPVYVQRDSNVSQEVYKVMHPPKNDNDAVSTYSVTSRSQAFIEKSAAGVPSALHNKNSPNETTSIHSGAGLYKPPFKSKKRMIFGENKDLHGIPTLPSDNIGKIVNHGYEKDYILSKTKKDRDQLIRLLLKNENVRSQETKASVMRNNAIKTKLEVNNANCQAFRLKQFDEVKPSAYISETTKDLKKTSPARSKQSNIEKASVLRIAEMTKKDQDLKSQGDALSNMKQSAPDITQPKEQK